MIQNTQRRILIFNVNWLGDVLFSTAVIRNIRKNFPESFISCIIPGRCFEVLQGNPYLDEIIIFDEKGRHKSLSAKFKFVWFLKGKKFDSVFLLHRSFSRAFICWLAGIEERIGYATKRRGLILTKKIKAPDFCALHRIDYYLTVIQKAGLRVQDRHADFFISDKDIEAAQDFLGRNSLGSGDFLIGINPGGNWDLKRWPKERWAKLTDALSSLKGVKVIIMGGPYDIGLVDEIKGMAKAKPLSSCGLNLKTSAALYKSLDLFITADSGPLHIANAVGVKKIIALFGPTSPELTGPFPIKNVVILSKDVGCKIPCYKLDCRDNRCMKEISVEDVMDKIKL